MTKQWKQEHLGSISLLEWFFSRRHTPRQTFLFRVNNACNHRLYAIILWAAVIEPAKQNNTGAKSTATEAGITVGKEWKKTTNFFFFHAGTTTHWGISFLLEELRTLHAVLCVVVRDLWRQRWPASGREEIQWAGRISGSFSVDADDCPVPSSILTTNR